MKIISIALTSVALFGSANAADLLVPKIKGVTYEKARELILKAGWVPNSKITKHYANDDVIEKYKEVVGCAVDRPVCRFSFVGNGNQCLAVFTDGELITEFQVSGYTKECEQP